MSQLYSPVAEATSGLPQPNYRADVIDSLKRLERIGAENSSLRPVDAPGAEVRNPTNMNLIPVMDDANLQSNVSAIGRF
jgi:hypothetical protein